jgi:hypothetical protein
MEFSAETEARIIAMYQKGTSTNNIGRRLGFHKSYAVAVLAKHHIPLRYRRITIPEGIAMAEMYAKYMPGPEIAAHFNTTATAVYFALDRLGMQRRPSHNGFVGECDHDFFTIIDTEPKAYFLSVLGGDGCVSQDDEIILDLKDIDIGLVQAFRTALKIGNPVRIQETEKVFNGYRFRYRHARVSVNSPTLAEALARYGVIPAKTGRTIPARIPEQVPARLERHCWRGWVDTDGWVTPRLTALIAPDGKRRQCEVGLTGDLPVVEAFRDYCERHTTGASIVPNGPNLVLHSDGQLCDEDRVPVVRRRDRLPGAEISGIPGMAGSATRLDPMITSMLCGASKTDPCAENPTPGSVDPHQDSGQADSNPASLKVPHQSACSASQVSPIVGLASSCTPAALSPTK